MQNLKNKLPITAFVASCNEAHILAQSLSGLFFCDEIIVINLSSTDNTEKIAQRFNARVLMYPKYPVIEEALVKAIPEAKHDWILLTDPDELTDTKLAKQIIKLFETKEIEKYGVIRSPIQYYFKKKALTGTIWGGEQKSCRYMFKRGHYTTFDKVHIGLKCNETSPLLVINRTEKNLVNHHYWMTSYKSLFEKHNRYIKKEGEKLYFQGERYTLAKHLKTMFSSFKECYYIHHGYRDGLTGLFLSAFWAYYNFKCYSSLNNYETRIDKS